jgi:hypothetical protein
MEKEEHHLFALAQRVQFRIKPNPKGAGVLLVCAPADEEFLDNLREAGIVITDGLTPVEPPPPSTRGRTEPPPRRSKAEAESVASAVASFLSDDDDED